MNRHLRLIMALFMAFSFATASFAGPWFSDDDFSCLLRPTAADDSQDPKSTPAPPKASLITGETRSAPTVIPNDWVPEDTVRQIPDSAVPAPVQSVPNQGVQPGGDLAKDPAKSVHLIQPQPESQKGGTTSAPTVIPNDWVPADLIRIMPKP